MAIGRLSVKVGKVGKAAPHAAYIAREAPYAHRLHAGERLEATATGNLPAWAAHHPNLFWQAADQYERQNGNTYREMEIALPRELSLAQRSVLVQSFVQQELGDRHAYQWAIHTPPAVDGGEQPHAHLMFSERQRDGVERDPAQYFKRYNAKDPEKGGARKGYGPHAGQTLTRAERIADLKALRGRWAAACNAALERAGRPERVDLRSHAERGLDLEPERKQLPSAWRQPERRATVLAFRQARAERARDRAAVHEGIPHPGAEIARLEAERARRAQAEAERQQRAVLDALAAAQAAFHAHLQTVPHPAVADVRPFPGEAPDDHARRLRPRLDGMLRDWIECQRPGLPPPPDEAVQTTAQQCYGLLLQRIAEWDQQEAQDALQAAETTVCAWFESRTHRNAEGWRPEPNETPDAYRRRIVPWLEEQLNRLVQETCGRTFPADESALQQTAQRCYEGLATRLAAWDQEGEADRREADQKVLETVAAELIADLPERIGFDELPYFREVQANAETERQAEQWILETIRDSLRRRLGDAGYTTSPVPALLEAAARRCYGPLLARVAELEAEQRRRADEAEKAKRQQEAERQRLLAADVLALAARRAQLAARVRRRPPPDATELAESHAGVPAARARVEHAMRWLAAVEAEDARWRAEHRVKAGLADVFALRSAERRELDDRWFGPGRSGKTPQTPSPWRRSSLPSGCRGPKPRRGRSWRPTRGFPRCNGNSNGWRPKLPPPRPRRAPSANAARRRPASRPRPNVRRRSRSRAKLCQRSVQRNRRPSRSRPGTFPRHDRNRSIPHREGKFSIFN